MNKRFAPQYLQVKEVDRENFTIRFVFSSGIVDRHGEIIDQKGWKLENYLKNPVVLWGHDQSKFPIGKAANMGLLNDKLEGDVIFAYNENPEAAIAFELCAGGFLSAGSVGFMNLKWMYDDVNDLLTLLENELFEFSIVNVPANPEALSKAIDGMKEKNVDKRVIDNVIAFQKTAAQKAADRFKDLGDEVKAEEEKEEVVADPKKPEDGEDTDEAPAEVVAETPANDQGADGDHAEPSEEEVKSALDVLFKSNREVIKASVKELSSRLNDAHGDIKDSKVDATPTKGSKKGLSNRHINSLVRSLLSSKA